MTDEDYEFNRIERESKMRMQAVQSAAPKVVDTSKEVMKLALEALEKISRGGDPRWADDVLPALREALANEALERMAENARELGLDYEPAQQEPSELEIWKVRALQAEGIVEKFMAQPQQEPMVLKWQQAPIRTAWGDDMVVASVAIDNDHTLSLYCERDQTPKVDAMFAQRTWVGLTDEEITDIWAESSPYYHEDDFARAIEAKLKERNT